MSSPAVRAATEAADCAAYPRLRHFNSYTGMRHCNSCTNGFELTVKDQIEFLDRHLSPDQEDTA